MKWQSDWKDGGCADLGYLEHLVCGGDDFFEAVDSIPCSLPSTNATAILQDRKASLNFVWRSQTRRRVLFGESRLMRVDMI